MSEEKKSRKKRVKAHFPKRTLLDALRIAQAIQDQNAGEPYDRLDLSKALDLSPSGSSFRALITASGQFGLTEGSYSAELIALTDSGRSIVAPRTSEEKNNGLLEALLSIDVFRTFFEKYDNKKIPDAEFIQNILSRDFGIPPSQVNNCYAMIVNNAKELSILDDQKGTTYVRLSKLGAKKSSPVPPVAEELGVEAIDESPPSVISETVTPHEPPKKNQVFIVHGKNRKPLEQLKKILDSWKVPYLAAIDEPHKGRPISQKVADLMHECTSAIVIFTADEKYTDDKGNEIFRPSDNAVYELGASSILYGNKIVILKQKDVTLASDFDDLGYISFEKDKLDATAMDLFNEFVGLGFLKVVPT